MKKTRGEGEGEGRGVERRVIRFAKEVELPIGETSQTIEIIATEDSPECLFGSWSQSEFLSK
jgi:hypothetical protein